MATKVLLRDENNVKLLPITRGELVLDSSGGVALHSDEFLATTSQPGLMSPSEKNAINNMKSTVVDDSLSTTSENPVQNKIITQVINETAGILNGIKEKYLKSASTTPNRLILVDQDDSEINFYNTTYNVVTNTEAGLAPQIVTATEAIQHHSDEWVLTSKNGETPTWKKLPINAFRNDNSDTTYSINGQLSGNDYIITLKDSSDKATTAMISPFTGSTVSSDGQSGIVPRPTIQDRLKFLRGDGTWATMQQIELNWDNILNKPETFKPESHFHSTNHIVDLYGYSIASDKGDLQVSDTLNDALGKLEYKTNLGVTAYDWYRSVTGEDTDDIINKWGEIVDFIGGITEDTDILSKFVTTDTAQTITGVKTFSSRISFPANTGIYYNNQLGLLGVASKGQWDGHPGTNNNYYTFVGTPSYDTILRAKETLQVYRKSNLYTIVDSGNYKNIIQRKVTLQGGSDTSTKPAGWYRCATIIPDKRTTESNVIISLQRSYNSPEDEHYIFSISSNYYSPHTCITQLSGYSYPGRRLITKVRLVYGSQDGKGGPYYFDFYYNGESFSDSFSVEILAGDCYSMQTPTLTNDTESYCAVLNTTDGVATNYGFTGTFGNFGGPVTLTGTTADTANIKFSRSGASTWNYIIWPGNTSDSCLLAFGYDHQSAASYYYMSSKALYPAQTSNTQTLGTLSNRWDTIFAKKGNYVGDITLYSSSGDSPHLVFQRANIDDGTWDWDQYVSGGVWYLRQNSVNNTPNKWQSIISASDTTVNIHKNLYVVGDTKLDGSLHKSTNTTSGMSSYLASFNSTASSVTGIIKITLPTSWSSAMAMYEIKIYEYDPHAGSTLLVSGYNYSNGSYYNVKYTVIGEYNKEVRFAHDGTNCCILLGNTGSTWLYPQIFLSNVYSGYSGGKSVLKSGYKISVITSESGLTKITNCPKATIDATTAARLVRLTPLNASHTLYYYSGQPNIGTNANEAKEGSNAWNLFSYPAGGTPASTVANIMSLRMQWSTQYLHEIFASPNNRQLWHRWINSGTPKSWSRIVLEDNDSESTTYKLNVDGKTSRIALNGINEETTFGDYGGIIQSSKDGPTGNWHNSLKILHDNSAGYYTQLAQTFRGEEGLWHRRCTAGTVTVWKKVIDSDGGILNKNLYFNHDNINYAQIVFKNTHMKADGGGWADAILTLQNNASAKVAGLGMYGDKDTLSYLYIGTGDYNKNNHLRIYTDKLGAMPIQPNVTNSYDLGTSTLRWNTLYANRCNLITKGLQYIGGKTLSNAAIEINTKQTTNNYFPIMAVKTSGDHVVNIGGKGDSVGFYGYYSSRTADGTDWEFYFDASNGAIVSHSTSDFIRRGGNFVLENTSAGETPHLVFRRGTSTDSAVDFDMYSNSGYFYLRGGSTSLSNLLTITTSSISIPLATTIGTSTSNKNLTVYGTTSSIRLTLTQSTGTAPMTVASTTVVTNLNADMVDGKHASDFAIPVGTIMMWAGSTAPTGWLLCNGAAVNRTTYSALFTVIGTTYGTGNGSTTFNLPNLLKRFPLGADTQGQIGLNSSREGYDTSLGKSGGAATHTLTVSELPSHRHSFTAIREVARIEGTGADVNNSQGSQPSSGYTGYTGSSYAHNNIPPFLAVNFIIKY